ncbi:putative quinol monooxygenase [Nocardia heshunensis]
MSTADREITVVATIVAKPDDRETVARLLGAVVAPTLQELGCLGYSMYRDTSDPDTFVAIENWRSAEDLDKHLATAHLRQLVVDLEGLLASPLKISTYHPLTAAVVQNG